MLITIYLVGLMRLLRAFFLKVLLTYYKCNWCRRALNASFGSRMNTENTGSARAYYFVLFFCIYIYIRYRIVIKAWECRCGTITDSDYLYFVDIWQPWTNTNIQRYITCVFFFFWLVLQTIALLWLHAFRYTIGTISQHSIAVVSK